MAQGILVIAEQREGQIRQVTHEALSEASRVAARLGCDVTALIMGHNISEKAPSLSRYGAKTIYVADDSRLSSYGVEACCNIAKKVCDEVRPAVVMLGATALGKDLAPRLAARLGAGLASDIIALEAAGGDLTLTRPIFAGKALLSFKVLGEPKIMTLRPKVFPVAEAQPSPTAEVKKVALDGLLDNVRTVVKETVKTSTGRPDVSEADIIVSGGRGTKASENFKLLEELADLLGAAVGASRAAVDAGWRDHQDQVGQTGKTVTPNLYIACGISGAIQHLAGMLSSKCIVAINRDPEAPIFRICDYGIVGDIFEIVPLLTQEYKAVKRTG